MLDVENCDLLTLFTARYALDKPNDVVNLQRDVSDLQGFPERLEQSYKAEWRIFVKRELHKLQGSSDTGKQNLAAKLSRLEKGSDAKFEQMAEIIKTAIKVNNSPSVTVMTTPLKSYVNQLLKL
jgi:hypothetical protein